MTDYWTLLFWFLLGIPVMIQYFILLPLYTKSVDTLWVGFSGELKVLSMIGIVCAFLSGLYLLWYCCKELPNNDIYGYNYDTRGRYYVYLALFLILFSSNFWWSGWYFGKKELVTSFLVLAGIGSILLMSQIWNSVLNSPDPKDKVALVASFLLMFQMAIMDAIVWNVYYWK